MSAAADFDPVAETPKRPRARLTGAVYLLYFLTAVSAALLAGRTSVVYSNAVNLVSTAFYIALTLLFYYLFKPVSVRLSLLAAIVSLVGCALLALGLFHLVPSHSSLFFFGFYCLLIGCLIFESGFLPRTLGVLMALAGLGWLTFLSPLGPRLTMYIEVLGVVAEAALMLWLLIFGVNLRRWTERATAADRYS